LTFARRPTVHRRALLVVPAVAVALAAAGCGGGSSTGHGEMPGKSSGQSGQAASPSASDSPSASVSSSATGSMGGMAGMGSYPPVTPGPASSGAHNDVDAMFANDMIPHHGQAVQMADMILAKTTNAEVKALAEKIKAAQSPEIATMAGWLKGWGKPVPDPYAHLAGMAGMSHGGMMSAEQMGQLDKATGAAADKLFLTQMQEHHAGAVDMAKGELANGSNAEAKKLAQSIITSQTAEIAQMKAMVAALG
jgi:uncharacterized protein (DUF305 family)